MKRIAFAAALLAAAETAALACVCVPFEGAERDAAARRIAAEAAAVAVVEQVGPLGAGGAPLMRVREVHVGAAPAQFSLGGEGTVVTSCDLVPPPGQPTLVVLYREGASYRIGGACDHLFINSPGAVELVRRAERLGGAGERG